MSDMKCPFCQQELKYDSWNEVYMCRNPNCKHLLGFGTKELWQELIRTRKALDAAINAMKSAGTHNSINCIARGEDPSKDDVGITINHALEQITALEQKENNNENNL